MWLALIEQKVFKHQFCYIDFPQDHMPKKTIMPPTKDPFNQTSTVPRAIGNLGVPILGKSNHEDRCLFLKIDQNFEGWFGSDVSLLSDGHGFWMLES